MNLLSTPFLVEKCTELMGAPTESHHLDKTSLFNGLKTQVTAQSKKSGRVTQFFVAVLDWVGALDYLLHSSVEKSLNKRKIYLILNTPRYIPDTASGSKPVIYFKTSPLFSKDEMETAQTIHSLYHCLPDIQKAALSTASCLDHTDELPIQKQYEMLTEEYIAARLIDYLAILALEKVNDAIKPTESTGQKVNLRSFDFLKTIIENGVAAIKKRDPLARVMAYYNQSKALNPDIAAEPALQKIPLPEQTRIYYPINNNYIV